MAKDILKEAIADAKAVREVALANAKAALEEAFTPKLQSMLSAKLSEDLEEDYYEEDMENEGMYDEDMDEDKLEMGEGETYDEELNLEDILNELEMEEGDMDEEEDLEEVKRVGQANHKGDDPVYNVSSVNNTLDNLAENQDFDLDSLLKEINDLEEEEEILEVEDDEILNEQGCPGNMVMNNEGHCMEAHGMMHHNMMDETMEDPYDDMMDEDYMEGHGMMHNNMEGHGMMHHNMNPGMVADPRMEGMYDEDMDEMMYDEDMDEMDTYEMDMMESKNGCGCKKENRQLSEMKKAYNTVKGELNEVNLLNSKLLYVNRIFKANNLSDAQKLRVVETLDKASSIKEAKLIYETVKDTFTISTKKKTYPKKSIRENFGMASKATLTSAPRKSVLNESNDMVARMQKLANISKIK